MYIYVRITRISPNMHRICPAHVRERASRNVKKFFFFFFPPDLNISHKKKKKEIKGNILPSFTYNTTTAPHPSGLISSSLHIDIMLWEKTTTAAPAKPATRSFPHVVGRRQHPSARRRRRRCIFLNPTVW